LTSHSALYYEDPRCSGCFLDESSHETWTAGWLSLTQTGACPF
jgi:hypothetical protein